MFIFPAFIHAQDTPLIEKKVTTNKMEKKDKKKQDQIYIAPIQNRSFIADGKKDAKLHYHYKNSGRILTLITSSFYPIAGLVPAISYSSSAPKDKNLNYPSQKLYMSSQEYNKAYRKQAHRMKKRRLWGMFGLGTLINLGVWTIIESNGN